jgi:hypothetical protein
LGYKDSLRGYSRVDGGSKQVGSVEL